MNLATVALLALVAGLLVFDLVTVRGNNRRALLIEAVALTAGAFFIAFPDRATSLAHAAGIGRGVDVLLYPLIILLVREALLTRRRLHEDGERLTQVVRALAIVEARTLEDHSSSRAPSHSSGPSASLTE